MTQHFMACLGVHRLRLAVALGYEAGEREKPQPVEIELRIFFSELPAACNDESAPFICYDKLSTAISELVQNREFRLIEFMAQQALGVVRKNISAQLGKDASKGIYIWLRLNKCIPPVPYMLGGASIIVSDLPNGISAADVA